METSKSVKLMYGSISQIYEDGLMTVTTTRSKRIFSRIPSLDAGIQTQFDIGDRVIVLTDGAQHIIAGKVPFPKKDINDKYTTKDTSNPYANISGGKWFGVKDPRLGTSVGILITRAGGIIIDSGQSSIIHVGQNNKISMLARGMEIHSMPLSIQAVESADESKLVVTLRNEPNQDQMEADIIGDASSETERGHKFQLVMDKGLEYDGAPLRAEMRKDGERLFRIEYADDGTIHMDYSEELTPAIDYPALAQVVHRMVMRSLKVVLEDLTMTSDFGRPMKFNLDFIQGGTNQAFVQALEEEFGGSEAETILAYRRIKLS